MKIEHFSMRRKKAYKLWKEYVDACKKNPTDKFLRDMKLVYNQLKSGRKIVDIQKVFGSVDVNHKFEPQMAIAKADRLTVNCRYRENGNIEFLMSERHYLWDLAKEDIVIKGFPKLPEQFWENEYRHIKRMQAPVPKIPASVRPKGNLNNYYILWEVKQWKPVPPVDPYLLRRITGDMFVVIAGWDLTELERAVMQGRIR